MNQQRDGRLGIGIIGAGKVGPILGAALADAAFLAVGLSFAFLVGTGFFAGLVAALAGFLVAIKSPIS